MASWGRHGWPRKNEVMRIYRERNGAHFIIFPDERNGSGYDAIANVMEGPKPSLGSTTISAQWIYEAGVKRVQWSEVPEEWQRAIRYWLDEDQTPESIRGFWLVGQQPAPATV